MKSTITKHQLNHILSYITSHYQSFAPQNQNGKVIFDLLKNPSDFYTGYKKTILPFKKFLFPNQLQLNPLESEKKIAILGLFNCDVVALTLFLKEFSHTNLLPKREDILIIAKECKRDKYCFCEQFGADQPGDFDLYLSGDLDDNPSISYKTASGRQVLEHTGVKRKDKFKEFSAEQKKDEIDLKLLSETIENREEKEDIWQGLANNCFGCGACTAVCPLCFCTRQDFPNNLDGTAKQCLNWDSCFAKGFFEIQNHHDLRPRNVDRLYNWYHHKFVRSPHASGYPLCTGCGRCIEACPANLNIKNILQSIIMQNGKKETRDEKQ